MTRTTCKKFLSSLLGALLPLASVSGPAVSAAHAGVTGKIAVRTTSNAGSSRLRGIGDVRSGASSGHDLAARIPGGMGRRIAVSLASARSTAANFSAGQASVEGGEGTAPARLGRSSGRVRAAVAALTVAAYSVAPAAAQGFSDLPASDDISIPGLIVKGALGVTALVFGIKSMVFTPEGHQSVLTLFGKYAGTRAPGFGLKNPFKNVREKISMQIRTAGDKPIGEVSEEEDDNEEESEGENVKKAPSNPNRTPYFEAITSDNARVRFSYLLTYKVKDANPETIRQASFSFIDEESFLQALTKTAEASARNYIAGVTRDQVQGVREELATHVKTAMDRTMAGWGYDLIDLQITDIKFDKKVQDAMAEAVAAQQRLVAATNDANASKIKIEKAAEAQATAMNTIAAARRTATEGLGPNAILAFMYMDTLRTVAEKAGGRINLFLDGSAQGLETSIRRLTAMSDDPTLVGTPATTGPVAPEASGGAGTQGAGGDQ